MNLFILDENPIIAAEYYSDKHVVKIILEAKQMLDYAHEYSKSPYYNNPVSQWVRESRGNYNWTAVHAMCLCKEYSKRYYKRHAYESRIIELRDLVSNITFNTELRTPFYQAVAPDCKKENAVEAYRLYYIRYKKDICKWKLGNIPEWFSQGLLCKENFND